MYIQLRVYVVFVHSSVHLVFGLVCAIKLTIPDLILDHSDTKSSIICTVLAVM